MSNKLDPNEIFESFWKEIVSTDGEIDMEKIKAELCDFYFAMEEVPAVYCHVTGNTLSKLFYKAEDVIRIADDSYRSSFEADVHDVIDDLIEEGTISKELGNEILFRLI